MRYLIFAVSAWAGVWIVFFSYAIFDGAVQNLRDKGQLNAFITSIALIVVILPLFTLGAGLLMRRLIQPHSR